MRAGPDDEASYSTTFQLAMFQAPIAKRGLIATFSYRIWLLSAYGASQR